jgi:ATP-binding cassette subfamily B protein
MAIRPTIGETDSLLGAAKIDLKSMPRVLGRLTALSFRYPVRSASALACALGATLFTLVTPGLLGSAIDQAHELLISAALSPEAARAGLMRTAGLLVAASAARGLLTGLQGFLGETIAQRVGYDLRLAFFEKLQRLSFSYHDTVHSGELITRGMLDLEGVRAFLESGLLRVIALLLLVGFGAWHVIRADRPTGLVALSFVPFVMVSAARMGQFLRLSWMRLQLTMAQITRTMEENLQGVRVVRAFSSYAFELTKFDRWSDLALRLSDRRITVRMGSNAVMNLTYYVSMGLVLWVGGQRVAAGNLSVGGLAEVLTFMTVLQQPVRMVGMIVNSSARATTSGGRLFEVLDLEPAVTNAPEAKDLIVTDGVLRFEHVGFSYKPGGDNALTDISFKVRFGRTLGIVGPPGSGKSTIAHLIPRFYDVGGGKITIDGQDIRQVTLASLRQAVAVMQQDIFLFDASVHDNVSYADPLADTDRVVEATTISQMHEHVAELPDAYDTHVGERGVALSGGQRQRLSIARGLVADANILVFDDSTAAIDATTETLVREGLKIAVRSKATIIIAHRLSSLRHADEIIALHEGRIVERGTHESLLQAGGVYADLWNLQSNGASRHTIREPAHEFQK